MKLWRDPNPINHKSAAPTVVMSDAGTRQEQGTPPEPAVTSDQAQDGIRPRHDKSDVGVRAPRPRIGRKSADESKAPDIFKAFEDEFAKPEGGLDFAHGELTQICDTLADTFGYSSSGVRKIIITKYYDLRDKKISDNSVS